MVKDIKRSYSFYWILFFGALTACVQHIYFIGNAEYYDIYSGNLEIRTISYIMSGGLFLLIGSIFAQRDKNLDRSKLVLYYLGLALIGFSYLMSLTRGIYAISIATLLIFPFLQRKKVRIAKVTFQLILIGFVIIYGARILLPNLDLASLLNKKFEGLIYSDSFTVAYKTRAQGALSEFNIWLNNTSLILGTGAALPPEFELSETTESGALYHVGFTAYLAHFGILGIVLYAVLLPFTTIKIARRYYQRHSIDYGGRIALIAIACVLYDVFGLPWSQHHLQATSQISGLIYGALWGLYVRKHMKSEKLRFSATIS
jgi:hypothetical protein